jgi:hypothetical protein
MHKMSFMRIIFLLFFYYALLNDYYSTYYSTYYALLNHLIYYALFLFIIHYYLKHKILFELFYGVCARFACSFAHKSWTFAKLFDLP